MVRRFIYILTFILFSLPIYAQGTDYVNAIKKIESEVKTQTFTFSKDAFALLTYFDINMKDEMKTIMDDVDLMKVVIPSDKSTDGFIDKVQTIMDNSGFSKVDVAQYANIGRSSVYVEGRLVITEAHFVVDYGKGAIVSFFGSFKMKDIKKLMKGANNIGWSTIGQ